MEYPQPPVVGFHAPPPPLVPPRPPAPPAAVFPAVAATPSAAGMKRKQQGNHVVHGIVPAAAPTSSAKLPPVSGAGSRTGAFSTPSGGRSKSQTKCPRKGKAAAARGRAPPPPNPATHVPRDPVNSTGVHNMFEETPASYNVHTSYAELLEENEVNIMSAPLDAFDSGMQVEGEAEGKAEVEDGGDDNDDVEELEEEEFDASQAKFGKQTGNYTEMEDLCLVRAWESVSLDA